VPGLGLGARVLPGDHVFRSSGGHDWRTWTRLWPAMLPTVLRATGRGDQTDRSGWRCRRRPSSSALASVQRIVDLVR
jgi:hypothetical protein